MLYHVLLRPVISVRIDNIEAESQEEAVTEALTFWEERAHAVVSGPFDKDQPDPGAGRPTCVRYVEHSEGEQNLSAMVDEHGDEEFENTKYYVTPSDDPDEVIEDTPEFRKDEGEVIERHRILQGRGVVCEDRLDEAFAGFEAAVRGRTLEVENEIREENERRAASIELCKRLRDKFESYGFETVSDMGGEADWDNQFRFRLFDCKEPGLDVEVEAFEGRTSLFIRDEENGEVKEFAVAVDPRDLGTALENKPPFTLQLEEFLGALFDYVADQLVAHRLSSEKARAERMRIAEMQEGCQG